MSCSRRFSRSRRSFCRRSRPRSPRQSVREVATRVRGSGKRACRVDDADIRTSIALRGGAAYRSSSDAPGCRPLCEETIMVVSAESREEAKARAAELGASRRAAFTNQHDEKITWVLSRVVDVAEIDDPPADGVDVCTHHFTNYEAYCAFETLMSRPAEDA
ncbi:MAG: DUF4288 domain-containing protein [Pseudonocardia sp.]